MTFLSCKPLQPRNMEKESRPQMSCVTEVPDVRDGDGAEIGLIGAVDLEALRQLWGF
jgi:hypothetical protein